jgi:hypothetical protein
VRRGEGRGRLVGRGVLGGAGDIKRKQDGVSGPFGLRQNLVGALSLDAPARTIV